jgi:hypothetical protein
MAKNIILQVDKNISAISTTNKTQIVLLSKHESRLGFQKLLHNVRCLCFTIHISMQNVSLVVH